MTAEPIPQPEPFNNNMNELPHLRLVQDELTADEYEYAMIQALQIGGVSAAIKLHSAEYALEEAKHNGASAEEVVRLGHEARFWRTVMIDAGLST